MPVAVLLAPTLSTTPLKAEPSDRPNVLLILTDDQGWGDLGVHGNDIVSTPTLDRLAESSVRLNRFYVSPVCAPTRAALLTGRYPERSGVAGVTGRLEVMRESESTMAERFRDAGYATGCFGKWHNGEQLPLHPNGQGFTEFFGFCGGHFNLYENALLQRNGIPVETDGYIADVLTDAAITFINENQDQPFFCYVPFNTPHAPCQVQQELFDKYNSGNLSEKTAAVYAMVENIDGNVARLLKALDDQGCAQDTIVLFLTDNGPNGTRYNGGMKGTKGSVHEGGCRVPCFIRWPRSLQPRTIEQITAHIDLLPTLAQWCGIELPDAQKLDGRSLVKLIATGADDSLHDRSILTYRPNAAELSRFGKAAVRTNRYRLTIENQKPELFDMRTDPDQKTNIADEQPQLVAYLKQQIEQYVDQVRPAIVATRSVPISKQRPTFIPSVDAQLDGQPKFADGIDWAHSWVDNWNSPDDLITWPIDFLQPGRYQITLHYVCDSDKVAVSAAVAEQVVSATLPRDRSPSVQRPDLDSESDPRRMQSFRQQSLGVVDVDAGQTKLVLKRHEGAASQSSAAASQEPKTDEVAMIQLGGVTITAADLPGRDDFHLFLLAGQSNMAGRGAMQAADRTPDANILMLDRNGIWVPATDPLHFDKPVAGVGLGRGFARQYASQHPGVTIGLVPCAVGGSPIASWMPGGYHDQTNTHPFDDAVPRIELAQRSGTFKGILWHQGESDCKQGLAEIYQDSLADLMQRLRGLIGQQTPILIGGLADRDLDNWSDERKQIDAAHRELAKQLPSAAFVASTGLTLNRDNVHFDRESLLEFGRRYADALAVILAATTSSTAVQQTQ